MMVFRLLIRLRMARDTMHKGIVFSPHIQRLLHSKDENGVLRGKYGMIKNPDFSSRVVIVDRSTTYLK